MFHISSTAAAQQEYKIQDNVKTLVSTRDDRCIIGNQSDSESRTTTNQGHERMLVKNLLITAQTEQDSGNWRSFEEISTQGSSESEKEPSGATSKREECESEEGSTARRDEGLIPPTNHAGQFICGFSPKCVSKSFDRQCDWKIHMDIHTRPYPCENRASVRLQPFTSHSQLLRHGREAHGSHKRSDVQLFCDVQGCYRKEKAFTRKENLYDHKRRVHKDETTRFEDMTVREQHAYLRRNITALEKQISELAESMKQ